MMESENRRSTPSPHRLRVLATMFFVGMLLVYASIAPRVYRQMAGGNADFSNFYTAGKILRLGQWGQLYDLALQTRVQSEFSEGAATRNKALPYMRPPCEALLFLPLSYLSFRDAYLVWVLASTMLALGTASFIRSSVPALGTIPNWLYYPSFFAFYPLVFSFALGQDAALMSLLFAVVIAARLQGKDFRAGLVLGIALIKFQLVLPLVLVLFLKKQFRSLAGFVLSGAILVTVSLGVVGFQGLAAYPAYLLRLNAKGAGAAIYPSVMPSLRGLVEGWIDPKHPRIGLDLVTLVLTLGLLIWAARQWRTDLPRGSEAATSGFAVIFLATLLSGYHEFIYDLSVLFPVILLGLVTAWQTAQTAQTDRTTRWMLALGAGALLFPPLYFLLLVKAQLNLMAIPLLVLMVGFSRLSKHGNPHAFTAQPC